MALTQDQIEQQDYVDNAIWSMLVDLSSLNGYDLTGWNIDYIGRIRDEVVDVFKEEFGEKFNEYGFYPWLKDNDSEYEPEAGSKPPEYGSPEKDMCDDLEYRQANGGYDGPNVKRYPPGELILEFDIPDFHIRVCERNDENEGYITGWDIVINNSPSRFCCSLGFDVESAIMYALRRYSGQSIEETESYELDDEWSDIRAELWDALADRNFYYDEEDGRMRLHTDEEAREHLRRLNTDDNFPETNDIVHEAADEAINAAGIVPNDLNLVKTLVNLVYASLTMNDDLKAALEMEGYDKDDVRELRDSLLKQLGEL